MAFQIVDYEKDKAQLNRKLRELDDLKLKIKEMERQMNRLIRANFAA